MLYLFLVWRASLLEDIRRFVLIIKEQTASRDASGVPKGPLTREFSANVGTVKVARRIQWW